MQIKISEAFEVLWFFLKRHKQQAVLSIVLILFRSVILGGAFSLLLPAVNFLFTADSAVFQGGSGYFSKIFELYNYIVGNSTNKEILSVALILVLMAATSIVQFLIVYVSSGLTASITTDCRKRVYSAIQSLPFEQFSEQERGLYVQLLITETRSVYAIFKQILHFFATIVNSSVLFFLLMLLSWKLSVSLLFFYVTFVWIVFFIVRRIKIIASKALDRRASLANLITESIFGLKQLRLLQAEADFSDKIKQSSLVSEGLSRKLIVRNALLPLFLSNISLVGIFILVSLWYSMPVFSEDIPKVAGLITFLALVAKLASYLGGLSKEYGTIFSNLPALLRVKKYIITNGYRETANFDIQGTLLKESVIFENVSFGYKPDKVVLDNLYLEVHKGSYIGIVGESGGGKSTLFDLLLGFYSPTSGKILIDGVDIAEIPPEFYRSKIDFVSQDYFLFNTSIRENMLIAKNDASESELRAVLKKVHLIEFVDQLDKGIDTVIGNNGSNLSGGQRQRLSMAIAFLRSSEIIIIDEGTSSLDRNTEKYLLESLKVLHESGKTIICSAHKDSALVDADVIYNLRDGRLKLV